MGDMAIKAAEIKGEGTEDGSDALCLSTRGPVNGRLIPLLSPAPFCSVILFTLFQNLPHRSAELALPPSQRAVYPKVR